MKVKYLIPLLVFVLIFGFIFTSCCFSSSPSNETKRGHDEVDAWTAAQLEVKKNLVAPSTAKFPWGTKGYVTKIDDNTYKINAYVDSENSFGAMIRTNFSCTVIYLGNDKYKVEDLTFW